MKSIFVKIVGLFVVTTFFACSSATETKQEEPVAVNKTPLEMVTDSIASDSLNVSLYVLRANMLLQDGSMSRAITDINKALSIDNKNIDALLTLSNIYIALGDQNNVLATLTKTTDLWPYDVRPLVKLAEYHFFQGNTQLAMAYVDKALGIDAFTPSAYFVKGMIYLAKEDTTMAVKSLLIAHDQDPLYFDPLFELAVIKAKQNDPLAYDFFQNAVTTFPNMHQARYEFALYLQEHGEPEKAMAHYDTLIELYPEEARFLFNKGYVNLVYLGDTEQAIEYFDKSLNIKPSIDALYNKGRALEEQGNFVAAKTTYLEVLKTNPDYQLAIDALKRVD